MWDKKKMGDMPKLLKDAAAAAAVSAELDFAEDGAYCLESGATGLGSSPTSSDDSNNRKLAAKQQQRKRPAPGVQVTTSNKLRFKLPSQPTKQGRDQSSASAQLQPQLPLEALPTPTGTPALQQWLQPNMTSSTAAQLPTAQQQGGAGGMVQLTGGPGSRTAAAGGAVVALPGLLQLPALPEMPRLPK